MRHIRRAKKTRARQQRCSMSSVGRDEESFDRSTSGILDELLYDLLKGAAGLILLGVLYIATTKGWTGLAAGSQCLLNVPGCFQKLLTGEKPPTPLPSTLTPTVAPSPTLSPTPSSTPTPLPTQTPFPTPTDSSPKSSCPLLFPTPRLPGATHLVVRGENLAAIARRYNTTWPVLVELNAPYYPTLRERPDCIRDGWWLIVPSD